MNMNYRPRRGEAKVETTAPTEKLYRGLASGGQGHFYTPDKEWARQFTQSGQDKEIQERHVRSADIHEPDEPVEANNPKAVDKAIAEAKAAGKKAVRLSEGKDQPNSVHVFDRSALMRPAKPFARGGIVTEPTLVLIGEKGPEAVIPLTEQNRNNKGSPPAPELDMPGPGPTRSRQKAPPIYDPLESRLSGWHKPDTVTPALPESWPPEGGHYPITPLEPPIDEASPIKRRPIENVPVPPERTYALAGGGIVTKPTVALIGEKGPEAVVPLTKENYDAVLAAKQSVSPGLMPTRENIEEFPTEEQTGEQAQVLAKGQTVGDPVAELWKGYQAMDERLRQSMEEPTSSDRAGAAGAFLRLIRGYRGTATDPESVLTALAVLPVELHKTFGILGQTGAEPEDRFNLGIRSPGSRPIRKP
jgi:SLT domain-containing protein